MVLTGFTLENGVYTPNAIAATGGNVDSTFPLDTVSTNAVEARLIAAEFTRLIGNSPENFNTLEEINGRIATLSSGIEYVGEHDITGGVLPTQTQSGRMYSLTGSTATVGGVDLRPGMLIISNIDNPSTTAVTGNWSIIDLSQQLTTLSQAQLNDSSGTAAGAITGTLFNAAVTNWYSGRVDQNFSAGSSSTNAISHGALSAYNTALLDSATAAGNTLGKLQNLISSLTTRVTNLETNKVVTASDSLPTAATQSLIHIYTDPDTVTGGDQSRMFYRIASDWYGNLTPEDFSSN